MKTREIRSWRDVADDPLLAVVGGRDELGLEGRCQAATFGKGQYALNFLVNYDGTVPEGTEIVWDRRGYGTVYGMFWRTCRHPTKDDFCALHQGMMDGFLLADPGRDEIARKRALRAKLNADRIETGTPANYYFCERFGG